MSETHLDVVDYPAWIDTAGVDQGQVRLSVVRVGWRQEDFAFERVPGSAPVAMLTAMTIPEYRLVIPPWAVTAYNPRIEGHEVRVVLEVEDEGRRIRAMAQREVIEVATKHRRRYWVEESAGRPVAELTAGQLVGDLDPVLGLPPTSLRPVADQGRDRARSGHDRAEILAARQEWLDDPTPFRDRTTVEDRLNLSRAELYRVRHDVDLVPWPEGYRHTDRRARLRPSLDRVKER